MNEILQNILLGITLAAPIGPASVAVIRNGFRYGFRRAFLTGLGVTAADLIYLLAVFLGLSSFVTNPTVKRLIWSMGALFLVYLGWQSIRQGGKKADFSMSELSIRSHPFLEGFLVNISNPIAVVFWLGIFGSVISASVQVGAFGLRGLLRSLTILIGILSWYSLMALLTHEGKKTVNEKTVRIISLIAGIALIGFGLRFAFFAICS